MTVLARFDFKMDYLIFADNEDSRYRLDEFEFQPHPITYNGVSCLLASENRCLKL